MNRLGQRGEDLAADYLESLGYAILERNIRLSAGELDAVAKDGDVVVFVEVKARSGNKFGTPQEAVNAAKQKRLTRLALEWLQIHNMAEASARFDVVSVVADKGSRPRIEVFRNAFEAIP